MLPKVLFPVPDGSVDVAIVGVGDVVVLDALVFESQGFASHAVVGVDLLVLVVVWLWAEL